MTTLKLLKSTSWRIGPLDVWPLRVEGASKIAYHVPPRIEDLVFAELESGEGPNIGLVEIANPTDMSFLIPEGWIVGADLLQTRVFNRATHIGANSTVLAEVSCVENQGRSTECMPPVFLQ